MTMPCPGTRLQGLTSDEAERRRARFGPNSLPHTPPEGLWRRLLRQFQSPLLYVLLFALVVDLAVWASEGSEVIPYEALAIAVILLLNAGLGLWQERKAEDALEKLSELAAPQVWTLRDGKLARRNCRELVPGDVIRLDAGDRVPADATVLTAQNLSVDESVLTGEAFPVDKAVGDETFSGTLVVRGKSYLEVTRIGPESAMGRLATLISHVEEEKTPLERRLDAICYRAKFAPTMHAVRQFINHGHVKVNGRRATISSMRLKVGDMVEVNDKSKELPIVLEALQLAERDLPDYVETDHKKLTAKLARVPALSDVPYPVQMDPALVVEYYSR